MNCPKCRSDKYCKNGFSSNCRIKDRKQRYRCYLCGHTYTKPKASTGSLKNWGYSRNKRWKAIELFINEPGLSYRAMATRINVSHGTVRNWIIEYKKSVGEHVPVPKPRKKPAPYSEDDAGHII